MMPGLSGFEVLERLTENPETKGIPVIFVTGLDDDVDEERGFRLGAVDYIRKPFRKAIVLSRVRTHLKMQRQRGLTEKDLARLLSVADSSPAFMLFANSSGGIEYMNPAVSKISGYSQNELKEAGLDIMLDSKGTSMLSEEFGDCATCEHNANCQKMRTYYIEITRKDGEKRSLRLTRFGIEQNAGGSGFGLTGTDITNSLALQRELIHAKHEAEKALAKEESYNRAKSDFLSRISHEMRTPLNAIIGLASFEEGDRSERIKESAKTLLGMINDILDISSLESGGIALHYSIFSLELMIEKLRGRYVALAGVKGVSLEWEPDPRIKGRHFLGDEKRLTQTLSNILSNAIKFTDPGGTVTFTLAFEPPETVKFTVADTGCGIDEDLKKRLWAPFEQANGNITRNEGGAGLGLTIARGIVDKMGGSIEFDSEKENGSRFTVTVNLEECGLEEAVQPSIPEILKGKKVLVVDDVMINREILASILEGRGVRVDQAENGKEALDMYLKSAYDLVLMDLHMPTMDGYEATLSIRAEEAAHTTPGRYAPILAVTADSCDETLSRCMECGMDGHIEKPVEPSVLFKKMAQVFAVD